MKSLANGRWRLDISGIRKELAHAPAELSAHGTPHIVLPLPNGLTSGFEVAESPVFNDALATKNPEVKTYAVRGIDDSGLRGRIGITPAGFHAAIYDQTGLFLIERNGDEYTSRYARDERFQPVKCGTMRALAARTQAALGAARTAKLPAPVTLKQLRTYRLSISTTAEWTAKNGGTVASVNAAIATVMNTVNAVYERDMSVHFQIVKTLVFTDPKEQPFDDSDTMQNLEANQEITDEVVGNSNYDIGHVFNLGGTSGFGPGLLCNNEIKAAGVSVAGTNSLQIYALEQVVHEIGHQLGANHTFNGNNGTQCAEAARNPETAYEVGSGVTIMSYAGICGGIDSQDLAPVANGFFHVFSLWEMNNHIQTQALSCGVPITAVATNNSPLIALPAAVTIPAQTPFALGAVGTDPDAQDQANLTYSWEQTDLGGASPPDDDDGSRPLFRNYIPSINPVRYFPSMAFILSNQNTPPVRYQASDGGSYLTGEYLPSTNRTMTFRLAVRDNRTSDGNTAGAVTFGDVSVNVVNTAGPFAVTSPNTAVTWAAGSTQTISWKVAGTDAAPISESTVRIKLSVDGGQTYPYILASGVPNNGSAQVSVPGTIPATGSARLMIAAEKSIFFDVSDVNFNIGPGTGQAPSIGSGGVISAAGLQQSVAPGSVISIYGQNFSTQTAQANAVPLPTSLAGVTVTVNGVAAPLFYVSPGQINAQVPYETRVGEAAVVVTSGGVASVGMAVMVTPTAPGVLQYGVKRAVVVNQDGGVNAAGAGAKSGSVVVAYMTGQGAVDGSVTTGAASAGSPLLRATTPTTVTVGGRTAPVAFSGLTPGGVGLMQVNFTVPNLPAGDYPLVVTVGNVASPAVTMTVSQ